MDYPNFNEEKKLWERGFEVVVGLDEAGRGPLAGPVVAGAVSFKSKIKSQKLKVFEKLNDSKKLSEKQREEIYEILTNHDDISWAAGIVSETVIVRINILEASKLAMLHAIDGINLKADFLLLDGNFKIKSEIPQIPIVKGDQKVFSIAAASIIAKVTRDRLMQVMHQEYPGYGFDKHKGYGTAMHIASIKKLGPCKIHRKTFWPVSSLAKTEGI